MTLRDLAEVSDVTTGALSQIENNNSSPSISTLKRILDALGSTMGDFFSNCEESATDQPKIAFRASELVEYAPEDGLSLLALPRAEGKPRLVQLLVETYDPQASTGEESYSHEGEECGICLEGEVELTVDGQVQTLRPGDVYYFASSLPHRFTNTGNTPAKIISAGTPSTF